MTVDIDELYTALEALAERRSDKIRLFAGFTDTELDDFPVPVPEPERALLRKIGGFLVEDEYFGPGNEHRKPGEPPSWVDSLGGDWDSGPRNSCLQFHMSGGSGDHYFVDIDRDTGHWGPIFGSSPDASDDIVAYQARSLFDWWVALIMGISATPLEPIADRQSRWANEYILENYNPHLADALYVWDRPSPHAMAVPYRELTTGLPPQEHRYFTDLPDDALAIDLSTLTPPTTLDVCVCEETERRGNGRYLLITSLER
ncbi:hypothetical protein ACWDOP_15810 [Nocardia sp. NPDC003693]